VDKLDREIKEIFAKHGTPFRDDLSEYHKGEWCPVQETFCQEGYCSGCDIARRPYDRLKI
jgi:hypothetical protein